MPKYQIVDKDTGRVMVVEGDVPPTPEDAEELFQAAAEGTLKRKPIYRPSQISAMSEQARVSGVPEEAVQQFISKSTADYERQIPPVPEITAYTPPPMVPAMISSQGGGFSPEAMVARPPSPVEQRMRAMQETMAMERMMPQVMRQATGGDLGTTTPSQQMLLPDEAKAFMEARAKEAQRKYGVPEFVTQAAMAGGAPLDVALSIGGPLVGSVVGGTMAGAGGPAAETVGAMRGGAAGAAIVNPLIQMRQMVRGERPKFSPTEMATEIALGGFIPKPLTEIEAARDVTRAAMGLPEMAVGPRAAEAMALRGGQGVVLGGISEAARETLEDPSINPKEILTVGMMSGLFGATFGGLEVAAPAIWAKIRNQTPRQARETLASEPQTKEVAAAMKELADMSGRPAGSPAAVAPEVGQPVQELTTAERLEQTLRPMEVPAGRPGEPPAVQAAGPGIVASPEALAAERQMIEQMAVERETSRTTKINAAWNEELRNRAYGNRTPLEGEAGLGFYEAATPDELARIKTARETLEQQERDLQLKAAQQERDLQLKAAQLEDQFTTTRLGTEETNPTTEMNRIRNIDRRLIEMDKRRGESARERARVEAMRAEAEKGLPESTPATTAADAPETTPQMSAQAERMYDQYGNLAGQAIVSMAGGAGGFVYGWNSGEDLPPEQRLERALAYGAGGLFSPIAIRKIIGMQDWATGVLKNRGPGSGALNTADPEILAAMAVKGAAIAGEGVTNFADWSQKMVRAYGDEARSKLKEVWEIARQSKLIPTGVIEDAPMAKAPSGELPGNTADVLLYSELPKPEKNRNLAEIAEMIQTAAIKANGGRITADNITPEQERRLVENGVEEVLAALKKDGHAGEWYTGAIDNSLAVQAVMYPAIRNDAAARATGNFNSAKEAQLAMAIAQAATSQNLTVSENSKYTIEQFEHLLKTGKFDPKAAAEYGTKGKSIAGNLELANDMVAQIGWQRFDEFLKTDYRVKDISDAVKKITGYGVSIAGKVDDTVQGASIFGPKIGQGFLQNLLGRFDPVTIDLWMRRTWGRWTGDVLAEGIKPEQLGRYIKTLRDAGMELPESMRGMRITPKGAKKLMIPERFFDRLATDSAWKSEIYDHAAQVFDQWNTGVYPYLKGMMTPEQRARVLSRELSVENLAKQLARLDDQIEQRWNKLEEKPKGKGAKAKYFEMMEARQGRTAELENSEISALKPEWAKSATVIVNVFEPIDVPSVRDREVITRIVNNIREQLNDRGIRMTNADIQATLWYPEKDIWEAVRSGKTESRLKQSYDTEFLKIAEKRGLGDDARKAIDAASEARRKNAQGGGAPRAGGAIDAGAAQAAGQGAPVAKTGGDLTGSAVLNRNTAGFINRQLGLSLAGFGGGFAYGMIEARDKPPEQRLANALIMGAASGALSPIVLGRALKAITSMPAKPTPAAAQVIGSAAPTRTLDDVRKIFKVQPDKPTLTDRIKTLPGNAITTLQNKFYPLAELQKSVLGMLPDLNLGDRFSLVAGAAGKAEADMIELDRARQRLIPDIKNEDLNVFLFLRRSFDRLTTEARNPDAGSRQVSDYSIPEIQHHLATMHNELGTERMSRLEQFAGEVQRSTDADLRLMVDSGRMSEDQYKQIKDMNEFYAPFYVMEYLSQREGSLPGVTGAIDTTQPLTKQITGIHDKDFKLGDMLTAVMANKLRARVLAEKNLAMRDLAKLTASDPNGHFIKDLGVAAADLSPPKGWDTVNYMLDGNLRRLAVSPEVAKAVRNMDYQQLNLLNRIMATTATPLRAGATGLNMAFQVFNQFKDLARFGLVSKYGLRSVTDLAMFPLDVATAAVSSWKSNVFGSPDQLMMDYLRSGAARSTIAAALSPDTFTRLAQQPNQTAAAKVLGVSLKTIIDTPTKIGNAIEDTAKLAGFKRGVRFEKLDKLSPAARDEAIQRIAYEVRNYAGSPDFSKHGTIGRELNLLFMFLNARIQGTAADLRRLTGGTGTREGWEAAFKLAGGVGSLATYVWYLNHQPDNVQDFESRPLTERNNYFLIPRYNKAGEPMYFINEDGEKVREYWRFPKAEIVGQVANITEGALNFFAKKDPKAAMEAGATVLESLMPVSISGRNLDERFESMLSGLNPILKAPIEYATNRNLFGHRDVVPRKLQQASPELQYRETTAPQFIKAAQMMPEWSPEKLRSPLHLQQLVGNFTGGLLTQFMRPELEGRDPLSANPVLGRFFSAPYLDKEENWNEVKKYQTKQTDIGITRERAIDSFVKNSDRMPIGERFEALRQIIVADPERNTRALLNNLRDKTAGTTNIDQAVRNLTPNLRAQYLEDQRAKLKDPLEQSQFYMTMWQRHVLTPETVAEIAKLRKLQEQTGKKP